MNKSNSLLPKVKAILLDKATEPPHTCDTKPLSGSYLCKLCGLALFRSSDAFDSHCGWPSFDNEIADNIQTQPDADGRRTEIICKRCHSHLGHVFIGEGFTAKNKRHCVNSLAIEHVEDETVKDTEEAIIAAGCFWGVQAKFDELPGVLKTQVGYTGGTMINPTYRQVCRDDTGHAEAVRIIYDPTKLGYANLLDYFFTIHDPSDHGGQGPDRGQQYRSAIFTFNQQQQQTATTAIEKRNKQLSIATRIDPVNTFWPAEEEHQNYFRKHKH